MLANEDENLWPSQEVQLFELMQAPVHRATRQQMSAVLCESGAGTGKTRLAGRIPELARRMNERGVYDKSTLIMVRRRAMILPQTFTTGERSDMLLGNKEQPHRLRMERRYIQQFMRMCGIHEDDEANVEFILALKGSAGSRNLAQKITEVLSKNGYLERAQKVPNFNQLLKNLCSLIEGSGVAIRSSSEDDVELLKFSGADPDFMEGGGDLLAALPEEYRNSPAVHVHTSLGDVREAGDDELPHAGTKLAVFSRTSLIQDKSRRRIADFLGNVGIIILDEAEGAYPGELANAVTDIGGGEGTDLFYASTASNLRNRQGYDHKLSFLAPETAINSKQRILKPQRLVRVETPDGKLYPSGSYEAADQLIAQYGRTLNLPKSLDVPQPTEGHHLVVVDSRLVTYVSHMLRAINTGSPTQVRMYSSNKDEDLNALLQQALNDPSAPPLCLVAGPDAVIDSFDWRALRSTWLGVHDSRAGEGTHRLSGRQFHTLYETSYIVYQQFANADKRNFLPHTQFHPDANFPETGAFDLVQGQTFLGKQQVRRERDALSRDGEQKSHTTAWTMSREYKDEFSLEEGTFPPKLVDQRQASVTSTIVYPQIEEGSGILPADYETAFAKMNCISPEIFLRELGDAAKCQTTREKALNELERAAHITRAVSIRQPRASYR